MVKNILSVGAILLNVAGLALAGEVVPQTLNFTGGSGTTVYGATSYTCPGGVGTCTAAPEYIHNNVTGRDDILSTPGNGYQLANPVIANNVWQTPDGGAGLGGVSNAIPYFFNASGGSSGDLSDFGAGFMTNSGSQVGFALDDTTVGCCSASYMIASWESDYTVGAGGWNAAVEAYLGIGGVNFTGNDASVASLITSYRINAGAPVLLAPMLLGIGGNCNDVASGGLAAGKINAACTNAGAGGAFEAAALSASAVLNLNVGDTLNFVSTLTVYADPSSVDSIFMDDVLLRQLSLETLPSGIVVGDQASVPEPGTLLLFGAGLASLGLLRRRTA